MQDVADRAGVSRATVSLVLSGRPGTRVSPPTVRRVLRAAAELGYEVHARLGESGWVTLLAETSAAGVLDVLGGALEEAWRRQHVAMVVPVLTDADGGDLRGPADALSLRPDDPVAYLGVGEPADETLPALLNRSVVVSCLRPPEASAPYPRVLPDDEQAASSTAERLVQDGHRRVALVADRAELSTATIWKRGLERGSHGFSDVPIVPPSEPDAAGTTLAELLSRSPAERPTAVVCAGRTAAEQAVRTAAARGLGLPGDVSIVVRDDGNGTPLDVPHTAIRVPARAMGRLAIEVLVDAAAAGAVGADRPADVKVPFAAGGQPPRPRPGPATP